jgi:hypothetical protein
MKSLKGEANLFELRPKKGVCEARPIYARFGGRFVVPRPRPFHALGGADLRRQQLFHARA